MKIARYEVKFPKKNTYCVYRNRVMFLCRNKSFGIGGAQPPPKVDYNALKKVLSIFQSTSVPMENATIHAEGETIHVDQFGKIKNESD